MLVTGVTGVTGYNALPYFQKRYPGQVIGIRPAANWRLNGPGIVGIDAEDASALQALFDRYRFRSVIHCAGNCALKACELDAAMARRINVIGTHNLLTNAIRHKVRLIHLSSDLVFSGDRPGDYTERDIPDPVTVYGKTMAEAEAQVLATKPDALVLRISLPMGPSFNGHAGAIDWIASRFKKSRPATLYFDEVRTPTYTSDMNRAFERLLETETSGLYHFGGPRKLSLYQIAQIVNRIGGYVPGLLLGCPRVDAGPMPPRAGNVTMDSRPIWRLLGNDVLGPWPRQRRLVPTCKCWHHHRHDRVLGHPIHVDRYLYRPHIYRPVEKGVTSPR